MTDITLHGIPEPLYRKLEKAAARTKRSVPAEAIHLIEQKLRQEDMQNQFADIIDRLDRELADDPHFYPDATDLIREDRER